MFDLFAATTRPEPELFYRRGDPNDRRLGELVASHQNACDKSRIVILGCPQDEGVRRNRGRVGAAEAPDEIRRDLYRLSAFGIDPHLLFDLGNTRIESTLEETHELHLQIVEALLRDDRRVIVLGGGNDISYPDCSALSRQFTKPLVLNIDAHFDVRADPERNSGTPYRQLLDEKLISPAAFFEIGFQPAVNSPGYHEYLCQLGVTCVSLNELQAEGARSLVGQIIDRTRHEAIFWGFDLDAVRASDAPGVSASSPLGLTGDELCDLADLAGKTRATRLVEFTEVNPRLDLDRRTSKLVAFAIHAFLVGTNTADNTK